RELEATIAVRRQRAAETGQPYDPNADRRAAAREEQIRQLKRQQTLARSLVPESGDIYGSEGLKALGKQGLSEFMKREEQLRQLRSQQSQQPQQPQQPQQSQQPQQPPGQQQRQPDRDTGLVQAVRDMKTSIDKLYQLWA